MTLGREIGTGIKVLSARLLGRRVPFFVQMAPTSACNLNCLYCFAQFHQREIQFFPFSRLKKVIEGLAELGTRFIMLTGGEPMMYPQIIPLIRLISENNIECLLNTNGVLVNGRMDELDGVDIYSISLDGPRELNDYYRGKGVYDKVLKVISEARSRGKRIQLQFTMTKNILEAFAHVNEIAEQYGCFIGINFLRPQSQVSGKVISPEEASQDEIMDFVDWLIKEKPWTVPYSPRLLRYVKNWPYDFRRHLIASKSELRGFKPIPCAAGRFMIAIEQQGNIFPCTKQFYGRPIGTCADGEIRKAWENLIPVHCQACLDLGCNLLNFNLRFVPSTLLGLARVLRGCRPNRRSRVRGCYEKISRRADEGVP